MIIKGGQIIYKKGGKQFTFAFNNDKRYGNEDMSIAIDIRKSGNVERYTAFITPHTEIEIDELYLKGLYSYNDKDKVLSNGFQVWTLSSEYGKSDRIKKLNPLTKPLLKYSGDYSFYDYTSGKGVIHSYTYTSIRNSREFVLMGSVNEDFAYTVFEHNMNDNVLYIMKDCSGIKTKNVFCAFDIATIYDNEYDAYETYFELSNIKKPIVKPRIGWTSWYNYYTDITEDIAIKNLNAFSQNNVPIDTFQIDDGYEERVGDWLETSNKFPDGMKYIADSIKEKGYTPGIWIAPFICERKSKIMKEHPEWVLKGKNGRMQKAGFNFNWSGSFYALDIYNDEFRKYLKQVFENIFNVWGFEFVKLDFLYAAAINHRDDKPRCRVMKDALMYLRELSGDKMLLGCGVPLGPSFGLLDYCRISTDVSMNMESKLAKFINFREGTSNINVIKSAVARFGLNGRAFLNDPDVFVLRDNNKLTEDQRQTLLFANLIFGSLHFTSDNIGEYDEAKLEKYLSIFPLKEKKIIKISEEKGVFNVIFEIEGNRYQAILSTSDEEKYCMVEDGILFCNGNFIKGGQVLKFKPFESKCFLIIKGISFTISGSMGSIFPGSEVDSMEKTDDEIKININKNAMLKKEIYIRVPKNCDGFKVNGTYCNAFKECGIKFIKYIPQ